MSLDSVVLVGLLSAASLTDVRRRRVPWWLTWGETGAGAIAALTGTTITLAASVAGMAFGALCLPLVAMGWFGGADALLLVMVGAWRGWQFALTAAAWTALAGGVLALVAWRRGQHTFAYVPAIALGTLLALLLGR